MAASGNLNNQLVRELIAAGREITPAQLRAKQLEELAEGQKLAMEPLLESQRLSNQRLARLKQKLVGLLGLQCVGIAKAIYADTTEHWMFCVCRTKPMPGCAKSWRMQKTVSHQSATSCRPRSMKLMLM